MPTVEAQAGQSADMADLLFRAAKELYAEGPGMAQESVVLRRVASELNAMHDIRQQQAILTIWHWLFQTGRLAWGYNIDNPGPPFFHFPDWIDHAGLPDWGDRS